MFAFDYCVPTTKLHLVRLGLYTKKCKKKSVKEPVGNLGLFFVTNEVWDCSPFLPSGVRTRACGPFFFFFYPGNFQLETTFMFLYPMWVEISRLLNSPLLWFYWIRNLHMKRGVSILCTQNEGPDSSLLHPPKNRAPFYKPS